MSIKKIDIETLFIGPEPSWNDSKNKPLSLIRALNWYANQRNCKDSKKYTLDYVCGNNFPKDIVTKLSDSNHTLFSNLGFICRIISRGGLEDRREYIETRIRNILNYQPSSLICPEDDQDAPKIRTLTVQERIFEQGTQYINELENFIEEILKTKTVQEFNCYEWLKINDIKPVYTKQIIDFYTPLRDELLIAIKKSDEQLVEGYSLWPKMKLKQYYAYIESIITSCNEHCNNVKIVRKSKVKKKSSSNSLEKKVSKLIFKKEDTEYKIVSVAPTNILSSSQLWVFNTKSRKLGIYVANDESGLSVKGSTIENYNETTSIQKTLRKPLDILGIVLTGKKTELKKLMGTINSKEDVMNGRINGEVVLLRVLK